MPSISHSLVPIAAGAATYDAASPNPQASTALGAAWVEAPYELAFQHPGLAQGNTISASTSSGASWTYV